MGPSGSGRAPVVVADALDDAGLERMCTRVRALLACPEVEVVTCDLGAADVADLRTVDALARLQLLAHRVGRRVRVQAAGPQLHGLFELTGLTEAVQSG